MGKSALCLQWGALVWRARAFTLRRSAGTSAPLSPGSSITCVSILPLRIPQNGRATAEAAMRSGEEEEKEEKEERERREKEGRD